MTLAKVEKEKHATENKVTEESGNCSSPQYSHTACQFCGKMQPLLSSVNRSEMYPMHRREVFSLNLSENRIFSFLGFLSCYHGLFHFQGKLNIFLAMLNTWSPLFKEPDLLTNCNCFHSNICRKDISSVIATRRAFVNPSGKSFQRQVRI